MSLQSDVKYLLETTFDLPFSIEMDHYQQEPSFLVAPANNNERLFRINVRFNNQIRLEMSFEPQKYGAQMVREMGAASESKKKIFCEYAERFSQKGAKVNLKINDAPNNPHNYSGWPDNWTKVLFRTGIRPIEYDKMDNPDYMGTLSIWLPLMMGMSLSLLNVVTIDSEGDNIAGFSEGRKYDIRTSRYERNPVNRILCLSRYGYSCKICGFDFEKTYGVLGKGFIHVHHIVPVSHMGEGYQVNPVEDLIPVCPNCHAMLHRQNPPITPEELKHIILRQS